MKKNTAREYASMVKRYNDYLLTLGMKYDCDTKRELTKQDLQLRDLGLLSISKRQRKGVDWYDIIPKIKNCYLFLAKYHSLPRNINNIQDWLTV